MRKIRSKNTEPELILRKALFALGHRYRISLRQLPGKPDITFTKAKVCVFVDGEFWHGFEWKKKKPKIKSNREYWIPKIEANIQRDKRNNKALKELGYTVIRFWEQQLRTDLYGCIQQVEELLDASLAQ
jgi:DNA mismatch endonuclease (patch repair protein)